MRTHGRRIDQRRRIGSTAVLVAAVAATALAAGAVTGPVSAAAGKPPTVDPSHGGKAHAWTVITPQMFDAIGPAVRPLPRCSAGEVTARSSSRIIPGGVAGIVHLRGDHCSIHSKAGPDGLRHGDATLAVDSTRWINEPDPPQTPRQDIPLGRGRVIWSFTWTGSWCGEKPTSVVVPLTRSGGDVQAAWHGPVPGCHASPGNQPSVLLPGPPTWPGSPDMVAGAGWSDLTAALSVAPVTYGTTLRHMRVTLTNNGSTDVALAPCPTYALGVAGKHFDGTADNYGARLPCPYQARVVPAGGAVTIKLPNSGFWRGPPQQRYHGRLRVRWEISGVPIAVAHTKAAPLRNSST